MMNVSSLDCSGQLPSTASTSLMHRLALPSPLSCSRKVEAFLGPLPLSKALSARKQWRDCARPSRTLCSIPANRLETSGFGEDSSPIQPNAAVHSTPKRGLGLSLNLETPPSQGTTSILSSTPRHRDVVLPDYEKGLEVHGRRLAKEYNTNWFEYWDFLGEFVDCSSEDGKAKLEAHLKQQFAKVVANEQSIDMDMVCRKLIDEGVDVENKDVVAAAADSESSLDPPFSATSSGRLTAVMIPGVSPSNHLPVKSHTQSPNRSSSSSSLGSLCQGLEAIRLNASLSPTASHYSPAAQRRYNELMDMIQSDESQLRELITSIDTSHLSLTADELNLSLRSDNWRLISYVAQSCRVTARTLACVLQDLVADPQLRMLPQLSIIRMVKTRIADEEGDEDDVEENRRLLGRRDTRKIHDRSDHAQHVKCVVLLLERALGIATNEGSDDNDTGMENIASDPISPNDDHVDSGHVLDDGCNEDNDDDDDSFATAANTSIGSSLATPEDIKEFYIKGIDVATTAPVDETKYPHLAQWQQLLQDKVRSSSQLELNDTNDAAPVDQGRVSSLFESPYCP
ncbi:hypothetical protein HAZT_HAZT010197, partial [Hyalella azteca]